MKGHKATVIFRACLLGLIGSLISAVNASEVKYIDLGVNGAAMAYPDGSLQPETLFNIDQAKLINAALLVVRQANDLSLEEKDKISAELLSVDDREKAILKVIKGMRVALLRKEPSGENVKEPQAAWHPVKRVYLNKKDQIWVKFLSEQDQIRRYGPFTLGLSASFIGDWYKTDPLVQTPEDITEPEFQHGQENKTGTIQVAELLEVSLNSDFKVESKELLTYSRQNGEPALDQGKYVAEKSESSLMSASLIIKHTRWPWTPDSALGKSFQSSWSYDLGLELGLTTHPMDKRSSIKLNFSGLSKRPGIRDSVWANDFSVRSSQSLAVTDIFYRGVLRLGDERGSKNREDWFFTGEQASENMIEFGFEAGKSIVKALVNVRQASGPDEEERTSGAFLRPTARATAKIVPSNASSWWLNFQADVWLLQPKLHSSHVEPLLAEKIKASINYKVNGGKITFSISAGRNEAQSFIKVGPEYGLAWAAKI